MTLALSLQLINSLTGMRVFARAGFSLIMKSILVTFFVLKFIHCVTVTITEVVSVTTTIPSYNIDLIPLSVGEHDSQDISDQSLVEALSPYHLAPGYRGDLSPEENRKWRFFNETTQSFAIEPTSTSEGLEVSNLIGGSLTAIESIPGPVPTPLNGNDDKEALYLGDNQELFLGEVPVNDNSYEIRELELEKGNPFIGIKRPFTDRKPNEHMPPPKNKLHPTDRELREIDMPSKSTSSLSDSTDRDLITSDVVSSELYVATTRLNDTLIATNTMPYLESTLLVGISSNSASSRTSTFIHSNATSGVTSATPATTKVAWPTIMDSSRDPQIVTNNNNNHPFKSMQVTQRTRATVGVRTNKRKPIKNPFRSSKNESPKIALPATLIFLFPLFIIFLIV